MFDNRFEYIEIDPASGLIRKASWGHRLGEKLGNFLSRGQGAAHFGVIGRRGAVRNFSGDEKRNEIKCEGMGEKDGRGEDAGGLLLQ